MEAKHDSVLMEEVLEALDVQPSDVVVDGTVGGAGHFSRLLELLGADGVLVGIDADTEAVERGRAVYAADRRAERPTVHLVNDNFRNLSRILERLDVGAVDKILLDLGWSGFQIASTRGFSFNRDEPLLMTYSSTLDTSGVSGETAADIVNSASEAELADLIHAYGEERFARGIARAIVEMRKGGRILTTGRLVDAVLAGTPRWYHDRKTHPATKTFQALRIATNDELGALREGITAALEALTPGGRLAVITFHSIEDRLVKSALRDAAYAGKGSLSPKKPIVPGRDELRINRRARSAKLRVFERCSMRSGAPEHAAESTALQYV